MSADLDMQDQLLKRLRADMQEAFEVFSEESRHLQELIEHTGPVICLGEYNSLVRPRISATHAIERYLSQRQELFAHLKLTHRKRTELQPSDSLR
jgi:hypothetical protein